MKLSAVLPSNIDLMHSGPGSFILDYKDLDPGSKLARFVWNLPSSKLVLNEWNGSTGILGGSIGLWFSQHWISLCRLTINIASSSLYIESRYHFYENSSSTTLIGGLQECEGQVVMIMTCSDVQYVDFSKIINHLELGQSSLVGYPSFDCILSSVILIYNPIQAHCIEVSGQIKLSRWVINEPKMILTDVYYTLKNRRTSYGSCNYVDDFTIKCEKCTIQSDGDFYTGCADIDDSIVEMVVSIVNSHRSSETILSQVFGGDQIFNELKYIDPHIEIISSENIGIIIDLINSRIVGANILIKTKRIRNQEVILDCSRLIGEFGEIHGVLHDNSKFVDLLPVQHNLCIRQYIPKYVLISLGQSGSVNINSQYHTLTVSGISIDDFNMIIDDGYIAISGTISIQDDRNRLMVYVTNGELENGLEDQLSELTITDETWIVIGQTTTDDFITVKHFQLLLPDYMKNFVVDSSTHVEDFMIKIDLINEHMLVTCTMDLITIKYIQTDDYQLKLTANSSYEIQKCIDTMLINKNSWIIKGTEATFNNPPIL
jgi:hypothetical protein